LVLFFFFFFFIYSLYSVKYICTYTYKPYGVICTSEKSFFAIERKVRKRRLLDLIKENPNMPEGKLKGLFSLKTGLTFNRIDAYIMELEESGLIERDEAGQLKATDSA
jgi:hypothetical protein